MEEGAQAAANVMYVPYERKWPKFSGSPSGQVVEEFLEEIDSAFTLYSTPEAQRAGMIYRNLEGQAKRVIAVLSDDDRKDLEKVKEALQTAYGDTAPVSVIMGRFYGRDQGREEPINKYALSLQEILKRAERRRGGRLVDEDAVLRDRFLDGLGDRDLERQLRQYLRSADPANPRTFSDIREEALQLSGEWSSRGAGARQNMVAQSQEQSALVSEIVKLREETGRTIEALRKELHAVQLGRGYQSNPGYDNRGQRNGPQTNSYGQGFNRGWDDQGRPICYGCNEPGHFKRDCPGREIRVCHRCKEPGHIKKDCPRGVPNSHNRPNFNMQTPPN
ncbi:uncharacterized protein LOC144862992 [Branchiostoma floridae x Branchiostoma japonicum]